MDQDVRHAVADPQYKTAPADLAVDQSKRTFTVIAEERLLMIVHDTKLLARLGRAVALLVHIVEECGSGDASGINLHEAARALGVPYSTVKSWLTALETARLITKCPHGRDGAEIRLNTVSIVRMPVFTRAGETLTKAREMLAAVGVTVAGALAGAESAIRTEQGVLI
jgi:DNA-binding transcriptional ArsR family regulator